MCTAVRFTDAAGNLFFGRNLDWTSGYGEQVVVTPPSACVPAAFERGTEAERGHAVIGMGIVVGGVPLYFDCANEAGLAVAGLNFPQSARYAASPREGAVNVAAYELPYWVARNFSTVAEARAALVDVCVVAQGPGAGLPVANLHWIVSDATGAIVVECLGGPGVAGQEGPAPGAPHVWEDDAAVLANEPDFGWHRQNLRNYLLLIPDEPASVTWGSARLTPFGSGAGMQGVPGDYCSPSRFVRAAFVNAHYPSKTGEKDNVTRLFRTLGAVAVPEGCAEMPGGAFERTLYTSGFSAGTRTYYHATYDDPQIRAYSLDACDLTGGAPVALPAA